MRADRTHPAPLAGSSILTLAGVLLCALATGCVDAPIQPAHLTPDGQLRAANTPMEQSALALAPGAGVGVAHQTIVTVTAVLAAQPGGALEDTDIFPHDVGEVHLHLRADGLTETRPVTFVWTHENNHRDVMSGVLAPSGALTRVSSRSITPEQAGLWRVEVYEEAIPGGPAKLLFAREFRVL